MSQAVLIATARVRPGSEAAFSLWQSRHDSAISQFPGFLSSDMVPPAGADAENPWTIVLNFETEECLKCWQQSPERGRILGEVIPLLEGGTFGESITTNESGAAPTAEVTEVIFSKVRPGKADQYREWAGRIRAAQGKYPGYRGMFLQPPKGNENGHWTTILRFDTAEHLEAWMNAPERKTLLAETKAFIESEELVRLATSFPGWVPLDPLTGEGPPNWKTALLVLLGLFPTVMLELRYLSPILTNLGLHASLATFIGNAGSVAITSFITMPLFVRWFGWWLFPRGSTASAATWKGSAILAALFCLEILALWRLLPW